jgi:hypothetical protein
LGLLAALHIRKQAAVRMLSKVATGTSGAGRREQMPEALDMCDNFTALRELQLFSPLEDTPLENLQVGWQVVSTP